MADAERKTARSVLAYERGARLASRLAMFSVLIGLTALILGGGVVWWARDQLQKAEAATAKAEAELDAAIAATEAQKTQTTRLTRLNESLVQLGSLTASLRADDTAGTSAALGRIEALLTEISGDESLADIAIKLRQMRIGVQASTNALALAIDEQRALNADLPPDAGRVLDLAILQCRLPDLAGARATLEAGLTAADAGLLRDDRFRTACGDSFAGLASSLAGVPELDASAGDGPDLADILKETDIPFETSPGRGPASVPEVSAAESDIKKIFLHIRSEDQRASAIEMASALCADGWSVPGIQKVEAPQPYPSTPRIIYYYADQEKDAAIAADAVRLNAELTGKAKWQISYDLRLYRADGLPRDRVEVWFPPETERWTTPPDPLPNQRFKCGNDTAR